MGSGSWSTNSYATISHSRNYSTKSIDSTFSNKIVDSNISSNFSKTARVYNTTVPEEMLNVGVRECRDTEEHPNTTPIIIAFDVTGSMGSIPHDVIKNQLPKLMNDLKEVGIENPQLLFMAIGDELDNYPMQCCQFESDTEKILNSLESLYIEGGGWGNDVEAYPYAWVVAGYHTEIDSWYKRNTKGFLFTIGDESYPKTLNANRLVRNLHYEKGVKNIDSLEALNKAKEAYNVYHIHVNDGYHKFNSDWKEILGDHVIRCDSKNINKEITKAIRETINDKSSIESPIHTVIPEGNTFKY